MSESTSANTRHGGLAAVLQAAASGRHKPVYMFIGDADQTSAAAHALIDVLVPAASRSFNLEVYDGRTTPIAMVLDSVRTPGFLSGAKVVWVRDTTLFLSTETRADLTGALLDAWAAGREREAAEKLLTLVALAGWSHAQFRDTRWPSLAKTRVREVCGEDLDAEALARLEAIQAVCLRRDLNVSAYRDDGGAVLQFLDAGMPPQTVVLFTAAAVDARKRLYKRLHDIGQVLDVSPARERDGSLSRETVDDVVARITAAAGKRLQPQAQQLIARRAGSDLAMLRSELEKLCLYVGERPSVSEDDVRAVFRDMSESWIFDFTSALAARQLGRVLPLVRGLLEHGEPPLRLLAMIAREARLLLVARECLDQALRGKWRKDLPFNVFQSRFLPHLDADTRDAFGKAHPFVLYRRFQDAARIDGQLLRTALVKLSDLDARLKSSRTDPALLLEAFVIDWCGRA